MLSSPVSAPRVWSTWSRAPRLTSSSFWTSDWEESASISMSVKVFLSPLTLYPFQHPLLRFSKYATQFKRLQFFPIQFKPCLCGVISPKIAQSHVPAVPSHVQDLGQLANPSTSLIGRFIKPLKWLGASKKLVVVMGIGLPLAYVATQMGVTDKVDNGNPNTFASIF